MNLLLNFDIVVVVVTVAVVLRCCGGNLALVKLGLQALDLALGLVVMV